MLREKEGWGGFVFFLSLKGPFLGMLTISSAFQACGGF